MHIPKVRKGQGSVDLKKAEFEKRGRERFFGPQFDEIAHSVDQVLKVDWQLYDDSEKSPRTVIAGNEFKNPDEQLDVQWLAARAEIKRAQILHDDERAKPLILVINGSPRSDNTCPGEVSKTHRLSEIALTAFQTAGVSTEYLDLSRITSEYGKNIHPCKACVSTAMPMCHWPCSCYPNQALGQTQDWMAEIYPLWVRAHGVMIISPVHWYSPPSVLKLMMDRLVCGDGGNPDPTTTHGKDAKAAKELELKGWDFPKHLGGRLFSVVTHGDSEGVLQVKQAISSWLEDMGLISAGNQAVIDRYIGYYEPYASGHDALDKDSSFQKEVEHSAKILQRAVSQIMGKNKNHADTSSNDAVREK